MFDWTVEITGTGDRSYYKLENCYKVLFNVVIKDTVIKALVLATVSVLYWLLLICYIVCRLWRLILHCVNCNRRYTSHGEFDLVEFICVELSFYRTMHKLTHGKQSAKIVWWVSAHSENKKLSCYREAARCFVFASSVQYLERSLLVLVTSASDLPMRTIKFCSIVFSVTSRLPIINKIYSCIALHCPSPAIKNAAT